MLGRSGRLTGLLVLGPRLSEEPYSGEDKRLLASVAGQAGMALENIGLAERMAERLEAERRTAFEMEIAKQVQAKLFPQKIPQLETLEYVGGCIQAREVEGITTISSNCHQAARPLSWPTLLARAFPLPC